MDQTSFAIIIILTTMVSYIFIRKYFKLDPKYLIYAAIGIFFGMIIGVFIGWPTAALLGAYGIVIAPYVMGIVLMVFIEFFIMEGVGFVKSRKKRLN